MVERTVDLMVAAMAVTKDQSSDELMDQHLAVRSVFETAEQKALRMVDYSDENLASLMGVQLVDKLDLMKVGMMDACLVE